MSLTLSPSLNVSEKERPQIIATAIGIPLYVYAVSMASLFTIVGILWDISWHTTIGRDQFLSPPHLLIYLGAIFGGLFSGVQVIYNSFFAASTGKQSLVKIWGIFYSSLGALFCIWGAIAMLTSAPFDDWWHNTYGLDVVILSPPHALLGLGMLFLQFGACVSISRYLNKLHDQPGLASSARLLKQRLVLRILFVVAAASLLCMVCTLLNEFLDTRNQRGSLFYEVAAVAVLLFLPAFGKTLRMKWGMTAIAIGYFIILAGCNWVLQLFPATPRLGPILNPVTHFQAFQFPLLIFVPAIVMDYLYAVLPGNEWKKSLMVSAAFTIVLLLVHYPLSGFLLESPMARNLFFGSEAWYYGADPNWAYRYKFQPGEIAGVASLAKGAVIAIVAGWLVTRLSFRWGKWLQSIQR